MFKLEETMKNISL